jgi:hypothetical protein
MPALAALLCLALGGCLTAKKAEMDGADGGLPGTASQYAPPTSPAPASAPRASPVPARPQATAAAPEEEVESDPLLQARTDCWMKVEHQKFARDVDKRAAFVDKCVKDKMKGK